MTTSDAFANEAESPYVLSYVGQVIPNNEASFQIFHFFLSLFQPLSTNKLPTQSYEFNVAFYSILWTVV